MYGVELFREKAGVLMFPFVEGAGRLSKQR